MNSLLEKRVRLGCALVITCALLFAAYAKFFYASVYLKRFDFWVALFEVLWASSLLLFRERWSIWALTGAIFSCWAGYALFWWHLGKPCGCIGTIIALPASLSLSIDLAFFLTSLEMIRRLRAPRPIVYGLGVVGILLAWGGFSIADHIYNHWVIVS